MASITTSRLKPLKAMGVMFAAEALEAAANSTDAAAKHLMGPDQIIIQPE